MKREISITEFQRNCSRLIRRICKAGQPLRITRNGDPVAEVRPLATRGTARKRKFLGSMVGTAEIVGDIVSPVIDSDEVGDCPKC